MKQNHNLYLKLAFEQARINLGSTKANPSVGCVVEKDNTIISSGRTSINGRPHAEYNALNKKLNFSKSNLYVTLEPCSHYGVTPPCTNLIKKKKIKNVYFSIYDFDKRSKNKAKNLLKRFNINAKGNYLKKTGLIFYENYRIQHSQDTPLIDAKIAISKDYYTINKKSKWVTNNQSRIRAQFLRSQYDCLITTSKTVNTDNPILDCRIEGLEHKSPDIFIIDRFLRLKKNLKIEKKSRNRKIHIITLYKNKKIISSHMKKKYKFLFFKNIFSKNDFKKVFKIIKTKGYNRIFVESGLIFLNFMISNKFVNNVYIFKTDKPLKRQGKNNTNASILKKLDTKDKKVNVNLLSDDLFKVKI